MAAPSFAHARVVDARALQNAARCKTEKKTKTVESITGVPPMRRIHSFGEPSQHRCACDTTTAHNEMTSSSIYIYITQAINLSKLHLDVIGALYKCKRQCNDLLSVCTSGGGKMKPCCICIGCPWISSTSYRNWIMWQVSSPLSIFFFLCIRSGVFAPSTARGVAELSHWEFFVYFLVGFAGNLTHLFHHNIWTEERGTQSRAEARESIGWEIIVDWGR